MLTKLALLEKGLSTPNMVNRFHATRPLREQLTGSVITFMLDLTVRDPASHQVHQTMLELQGNCVLQLIGLQWRRESFQRSALARRVKDMLDGSLP